MTRSNWINGGLGWSLGIKNIIPPCLKNANLFKLCSANFNLLTCDYDKMKNLILFGIYNIDVKQNDNFIKLFPSDSYKYSNRLI